MSRVRMTDAIVAGMAGLASVSLATCAVPDSARRAPPSVQAMAAEESVQTGFGEFARAGLADGAPDWRRRETTVWSGGRSVQTVFGDITGIEVDAQTLSKPQSPEGQGVLRVTLIYRNARGLRQNWDEGPVRVRYTLTTAENRPQVTSNDAGIVAGDTLLKHPGSTFDVVYPLPLQNTPTSWGTLQGTVQLPNGRVFEFREPVVRRSKWVP